MPGILASAVLLWHHGTSPIVSVFVVAVLVLAVAAFAWLARERTRFPLRTISNLIAGIREGDFSIRARGERPGDALGEVIIEVNALCESLRQLRLGRIEATNLLHRVMDEINVAIFTFDE
ncbi:MAG TPA: PAS domain-containing sensor histidine kinase, partial [Verrucomicrobiae bacterium]|nr:PAS domain-containing sensor histidine kinase [Verrucomicrobiae bacterium]